jgi:hypothetical protein
MTVRRKKAPFGVGLLVIGGQCRKVGKTALVLDLIRAFPRAHWTAVKITPYTEEGCPVRGARCNCGPKLHTYAIREESDRSGRSDTSRFLEGGADRALWVQTKEGRVVDALGPLAEELAKAGNVIVESDAIISFWKPDLHLMVLDPRIDDFKASARHGLRFADAFVYRSLRTRKRNGEKAAAAEGVRATFFHPLGKQLPKGLQRFVMRQFVAGEHPIIRS